MTFTETQTKKVISRLEEKRVVTPSGCWEFTGARDKDGYGLLKVYGKLRKAHKVSGEIFKNIPETSWTCHSCDNPPCWNPEHLFEGDASVNAIDAFQKGRRVSGWIHTSNEQRRLNALGGSQ